MRNKIYRIISLFFIVVLVFPLPVQAEEPEGLYALSACLMDGNSGRVLYGKDADSPMPMASTTKIMTCILALESMDLNAEITFSKKAAAQPKVHLGAPAGTKFILQDLLYSLMLESHNDSAVAIAEGTAGSVEAFAEMMNRKAGEIGCKATHFVTPNGLDAEDAGGEHHTTASDLARILYYCINQSDKKDLFLEITRTPSYTVQDSEGKHMYQCNNHNAFLTMMDGALTGKTGFTNKAGYCYIGALTRGDRTFIVALLACGWPNHKSYKWSDTRKLMEYALENYSYQDVFDKNPSLNEIWVKDGISGSLLGKKKVPAKLYLDAPADESLQVLLKEGENVEIAYEYPQQLSAPLEKGQQIGEALYTLNGEVLAKYPIRMEESIEKKDYGWCLQQIAARYAVSLFG